METLVNALKPMFTSLPKNEYGKLGHDVVRYALHRYFNNRHGWFVRGLEPGNATWSMPPNAFPGTIFIKEWVPSFLQETLEQRPGGASGADIHDLAVLAATMEDLINKETRDKLSLAYSAEEISVSATLNKTDADAVVS